MNHREAWANLDAFLDGELPPPERWAIATHLNGCAACQAYIDNQAAIRQVVRARLSDVAIPAGLQDRLKAAIASESVAPAREPVPLRTSPVLLRLVAVLGPVLVGLGLLARLLAPGTAPEVPADLQTEMTITHLLYAQDTSKLDVVGNAATVSDWFRDKGGLIVSVPSLDGFLLRGGRLLLLNGDPVAQIVYQSDPGGAYLSFLRFEDYGETLRDAPVTDGIATKRDGLTSIATWTDGEDRTVLIGEVPVDVLLQLAEGLRGHQPALIPATPPIVRTDLWYQPGR
jgi:anti-sigma factor RsiW